MLIRPLTFVTDFIHTLNASLAMIKPNATLTRAQKVGLSFLLSAWRKKNKALKKSGVAASIRPKAPSPEYEKYPQKQTLALSMLKDFVDAFPDIINKDRSRAFSAT
jgi:hypothetical protein